MVDTKQASKCTVVTLRVLAYGAVNEGWKYPRGFTEGLRFDQEIKESVVINSAGQRRMDCLNGTTA